MEISAKIALFGPKTQVTTPLKKQKISRSRFISRSHVISKIKKFPASIHFFPLFQNILSPVPSKQLKRGLQHHENHFKDVTHTMKMASEESPRPLGCLQYCEKVSITKDHSPGASTFSLKKCSNKIPDTVKKAPMKSPTPLKQLRRSLQHCKNSSNGIPSTMKKLQVS